MPTHIRRTLSLQDTRQFILVHCRHHALSSPRWKHDRSTDATIPLLSQAPTKAQCASPFTPHPCNPQHRRVDLPINWKPFSVYSVPGRQGLTKFWVHMQVHDRNSTSGVSVFSRVQKEDGGVRCRSVVFGDMRPKQDRAVAAPYTCFCWDIHLSERCTAFRLVWVCRQACAKRRELKGAVCGRISKTRRWEESHAIVKAYVIVERLCIRKGSNDASQRVSWPRDVVLKRIRFKHTLPLCLLLVKCYRRWTDLAVRIGDISTISTTKIQFPTTCTTVRVNCLLISVEIWR